MPREPSTFWVLRLIAASAPEARRRWISALVLEWMRTLELRYQSAAVRKVEDSNLGGSGSAGPRAGRAVGSHASLYSVVGSRCLRMWSQTAVHCFVGAYRPVMKLESLVVAMSQRSFSVEK